MVFAVEGLTTNIVPTNEATLPNFACSASSNHENIIHEMTQPRIFAPRKLPAIRYTIIHTYNTRFLHNYNTRLLHLNKVPTVTVFV